MCSVPIQLRHVACLIQHELTIIIKWSRKLVAFSIAVSRWGGYGDLLDSQYCSDQVYATGYGRYELLDCHRSTR